MVKLMNLSNTHTPLTVITMFGIHIPITSRVPFLRAKKGIQEYNCEQICFSPSFCPVYILTQERRHTNNCSLK